MLYKEFQLHPKLSNLIKCYWIFENKYGQNHLERVMPDGFIDFVFHYGQRPTLIIEGRQICKTADFLGGHLTSPAELCFSGDLNMFGIKFYPWASVFLYKMPAFELNNMRVDAYDLLGKWVRDCHNQMKQELHKANYTFVIQTIESNLLKKTLPFSNQELILKYCFENIFLTHGQTSIDNISKKLGYSARYIQQVFKNRKGKSYNYYSRLNRLHYAIDLINRRSKTNFTDISCETGFFDQSHFIKEFKMFTGYNPSEFVMENNDYIKQNSSSVSTLHH